MSSIVIEIKHSLNENWKLYDIVNRMVDWFNKINYMEKIKEN